MDITMCKGQSEDFDCPLKEKCYRHTAKADEYQSFFYGVPYNKDKHKCEHFWEDKRVKENPQTK